MNQPATAESLTESMGAKEIGALMARLRAQFSLTQQEVSERLHIRPRYISAMEEGRFELMPGKVYARGYVHTYAEFLGLDADQVVVQCFTGEGANAAAAQPAPVTRTPIPSSHPIGGTHWRGYGVLGVIALVVILLIGQLTGHSDEPKVQEATVAPVPEAMLQSTRTLMMPTGQNHDCVVGDAVLGCFAVDRTSQRLLQLHAADRGLLSAAEAEALMKPEPVEEDAPKAEEAKPEPAIAAKEPAAKSAKTAKEKTEKPKPEPVKSAPAKAEEKAAAKPVVTGDIDE